MGIARKTYEKIDIGVTGTIQFGGSGMPSLEAFQSVVEDLEELAVEGLIEIKSKHPEAQSGGRYIDLVMFKRLA